MSDFIPGELLEVAMRQRRTGVIVAVPMDTSTSVGRMIRDELEERFPAVTFAVIAGAASSLAFEWDEPEDAL